MCIIEQGGKCLLGEITIADSILVAVRDPTDHTLQPPPANPANFLLNPENQSKHCVEDLRILDGYKQVYAWVLKDPLLYDPPKPYTSKKGAIVFVNLLDPEVSAQPNAVPLMDYADELFLSHGFLSL